MVLYTSGFVPASSRRLHSVDVVDRVNESQSAAFYSTATAPIPAPSFRDCHRRAFTSLPVYQSTSLPVYQSTSLPVYQFSITNFRYFI